MTDVWVLSRCHREDFEGATWENDVHSVHSTADLGKAQVPSNVIWLENMPFSDHFFTTNVINISHDLQVFFKLELHTVGE
jgi:hypothetical protein